MYKIIRMYRDRTGRHGGYYKRTIHRGLTLEEAQEHCSDPETSSSTATSASARRRTRQHGAWFDGYSSE